MKKISLCIALFSVTACASQTIKFSDANVTTRGSDEPNSLCQNFKLTNHEALTFFTKATEITAKELHDQYDYLPCYVNGTIARKDAPSNLHNCTFSVRGGGTAELACNKEVKLYACKTCDDLFKDKH